jgi:hypothetical protein
MVDRYRKVVRLSRQEVETAYLKRIIMRWKPELIHTLGFDPAGFTLNRIHNECRTAGYVWIHTARGGPELALKRLEDEPVVHLRDVLAACDQFIADNKLNYQYAVDLGMSRDKMCPLGAVPGTGGIDVAKLSSLAINKNLKNRTILYPKAYECAASKALPVLEAIRLCWDKIKPCQIHFTAVVPEVSLWVCTLPRELRNSITISERLPRDELLKLMAQSRVMLAPSLTDGIPNVVYEAMATKTVPIVSPIETLVDLFQEERNVLYARNLYPEEIATALVRAMNNDRLVSKLTDANQHLVREVANRQRIAAEIGHYYKSLVR